MSILNDDLNGSWVRQMRMDANAAQHAEKAAPKGRIVGSYLPFLTGVIILAALLIQALFLWQARQDAWNRAVQSGENLMNTLSASVEQNLNAIELSLNTARSVLEGVDLEGLSPRQTGQFLFDRALPTGLVSSMFAMSRRGEILAESGGAKPSATDLSDRDFFLAHIRKNIGTYISPPFRDRLHGGDPSIAISQRLPEVDGSFKGVVVAIVRLAYFRSLFANVKLGSNGVVSLAETSGAMLMRWPSTDGEGNIGLDLNRMPVFEQMLTSSDYFVGKASIDGQKRLYIHTQVGSFPLLLSVSLALDDIYAEWNQQAIVAGSLTFAFCIALGCLARALQLGIARSAHMEDLLKTLSLTDAATGLPNRRAFDERLDSELRRMTREGSEMALLLVDVDHFKVINEAYGHAAGDKFLVMLGQQMRRSAMRPGDMVARFGDEEFALLLPSTDLKGAMHIAERVRSDIERTSVALDNGFRIGTTVSIGVVTAQPASRMIPRDLLKLAETGLTKAKAKGGNQVVRGESPKEAADRHLQRPASGSDGGPAEAV